MVTNSPSQGYTLIPRPFPDRELANAAEAQMARLVGGAAHLVSGWRCVETIFSCKDSPMMVEQPYQHGLDFLCVRRVDGASVACIVSLVPGASPAHRTADDGADGGRGGAAGAAAARRGARERVACARGRLGGGARRRVRRADDGAHTRRGKRSGAASIKAGDVGFLPLACACGGRSRCGRRRRAANVRKAVVIFDERGGA